MHLYAFLCRPLSDLRVPSFRERRVVEIVSNRANFLRFVNLLHNLQAVPIKVVQPSPKCLNFLVQLIQRLNHELHAIVGEVGIVLGDDLLGSEDENGRDFLVAQDLQDEGGVVEETQVSVEDKYIHFTGGIEPRDLK